MPGLSDPELRQWIKLLGLPHGDFTAQELCDKAKVLLGSPIASVSTISGSRKLSSGASVLPISKSDTQQAPSVTSSHNHYCQNGKEYPNSNWILYKNAFEKIVRPFLFRIIDKVGLGSAFFKMKSDVKTLSKENLFLLISWFEEIDDFDFFKEENFKELKLFKFLAAEFIENDEIKSKDTTLMSFKDFIPALSRAMVFFVEIPVLLQAKCDVINQVILDCVDEFKRLVRDFLSYLVLEYKNIVRNFLFRGTRDLMSLEDAFLNLKDHVKKISKENTLLLITWFEQINESDFRLESNINQLKLFKEKYHEFKITIVIREKEGDETKQKEEELPFADIVEVITRIMRFIDESAMLLLAECRAVRTVILECSDELKHLIVMFWSDLKFKDRKLYDSIKGLQENLKVSGGTLFFNRLPSIRALSPLGAVSKLKNVSELTGSLSLDESRVKASPETLSTSSPLEVAIDQRPDSVKLSL